jgi:hypothetical protein
MKQSDELQQRPPRQALSHVDMEFVADAANPAYARNSLEPFEKRSLVASRVVRAVGSSNQSQ